MALIDGREVAASGTLVIPAGRSGSLEFFGTTLHLEFRESEALTIALQGSTIVISGPDNPLGNVIDAQGIYMNGVSYNLALAIHAITGAERVSRVISYTLYRAG